MVPDVFHDEMEIIMQRITWLVVLILLAFVGPANVVVAQEPCCHRPVLRASAMLVRGAVRLVTLPVRLLVCHHGCGCECGYGCHGCWHGCCHGGCEMYGAASPYDVPGYIPGAGLPAAEAITGPAAWNPPAAVYTPVVAAEDIEGLNAEDCQRYAAQAIACGIGHYRQGEIEVATQYFSEATVLTPDMAAAWGLLGVAATAAQETPVAAECATQVAEICSANPQQRSRLYRLLAPLQGESRANFEQLVRSSNERNSVQDIARLP